MGRINHLLKFACIAAALTLLAASPALTARPPEPLAETVEMRLLPDDRPIPRDGDGRVLELRAPAAGQLPSHGFDRGADARLRHGGSRSTPRRCRCGKRRSLRLPV